MHSVGSQILAEQTRSLKIPLIIIRKDVMLIYLDGVCFSFNLVIQILTEKNKSKTHTKTNRTVMIGNSLNLTAPMTRHRLYMRKVTNMLLASINIRSQIGNLYIVKGFCFFNYSKKRLHIHTSKDVIFQHQILFSLRVGIIFSVWEANGHRIALKHAFAVLALVLWRRR